ncbi:hypothetical protein ACFY2Z_40145 [Streptomyces sp. NPDC001222]|uniref:hypothetical protein n=1 Tax=Streptomyces sp. NPDC001222 TaxID=3364548 RepID=UPI00368DFE14
MKKMVIGVAIAGVAMLGASPAMALSAYSPSAKAYAETHASDSQVSLAIYTDQWAHADYYRTTDPSDPYHLWNKSAKDTTSWSGKGGKVTQIRTCNWVKDNDDECSRWYR